MQQSQQSLPNTLTKSERSQLRRAFFWGAVPLLFAALVVRGAVHSLGELWLVLLGLAFFWGRQRVKAAGLLRAGASVEVWSRTPRAHFPPQPQEVVSQQSAWQLALVLLVLGIVVFNLLYFWPRRVYPPVLLSSIPALLCLVGLFRFFTKASETVASLDTRGVTLGENQVLWEQLVSVEITQIPLFLGHETQLTLNLTDTAGQLHTGRLTTDPFLQALSPEQLGSFYTTLRAAFEQHSARTQTTTMTKH
jgi:hypothetical protein